MYAGIERLIFPNGPSISTVAPCWVLLTRPPAFGAGASVIRKDTVGGNESVALPILERHDEDVEKLAVL